MNNVAAKVCFALGFCIAFSSTSSAAPVRCATLFSSSTPDLPQFTQDFGPGLYVRKQADGKFHIEPPPFLVEKFSDVSATISRSMARKDSPENFTFFTIGLTELDVSSLQTLMRKGSNRNVESTLLLLDGPVADGKEYANVRAKALRVNEYLGIRRNWGESRVTRLASPAEPLKDIYKIEIPHQMEEGFLLKIKWRAKKFLSDRGKAVVSILRRPDLQGATLEQTAQALIKDMRKSDPGISSITFKALAVDFTIANRDQREIRIL